MMNATETIAALLDENQAASVTAIISMLADRTTFGQRFNVIKAAAKDANEKMRDAQALADKHANAESMLTQATAMLVKQNERSSELSSREFAVVEREQSLAAAEKAGREDHTRIEVALAAREKRVQHREQLLAEGQANLAQAKTQVDAQVASLAEFRGLAQSLRNPA